MHRRRRPEHVGLITVLAVLGALAGVCGAAVAAAKSAPVRHRVLRLDVYGSFDQAGRPVASAYVDGPKGIRVNWSVCPPAGGGVCRAIPSEGGQASPGPEPAGTVFRAAVRYRGHTYAKSETWRGAPHPVSPPALVGSPSYGSVVSSSTVDWVGGWPQPRVSGLQALADDSPITLAAVIACPTTAGRGCVTLSGDALDCGSGSCVDLGGLEGSSGYGSSRATVGNWFTGWYLFAVSARLPSSIDEIVGFTTEAAIPVWKPTATVVRSAPYGPVTGPPSPTVDLLPVSRADGGREVIGTVNCPIQCHVSISTTEKHPVIAAPGGWSGKQVVTGSSDLSIRGPLPTDHYFVSVNVDDGPYITRITRVTGPPAWQDLAAEYLARVAELLARNLAHQNHGSYAGLARSLRLNQFTTRAGDGARLSTVTSTRDSFTVTATSPTGRTFTSHAGPTGAVHRTCKPSGGGCSGGHWDVAI